ncbi:hypothetical protein C9I57_11335 [Trinickia symbiotica]|uniref:Uncharacterized protein n=1 Tax=Trinickia symbiotica TaxID=863227 RepID=A0A2T3XVD5_9BURK|nr:hypothetical protein [Trinickia symbiotica]PTB20457.1 hypothetical protein C9I57_11335 [Trinickia symbiotica]
MNITQSLNIASATIGVLGTFLMYKGTFGLVVPGFYFMDEAANKATQEANNRRAALQRIGLCMLTISFMLQGTAQFTPE